MRRRCFTRTAGSINNLGSSPSGLRRDRAQCNSAVETHVLPGHEGFSADASTLDLEAGRILEVRLCNVTTADDQRIIAMRVETHEAEVWARCFELAAAVPGNPLGAVIDRSGPCPLPALTAVDSGSFNRIVALGVADPGDPDTIDRIVSFYRDLGQLNYRVELAPVAPPDVAPSLERAGLRQVSDGTTKVWRRIGSMDGSNGSTAIEGVHDLDQYCDPHGSQEARDIRRLSAADAEQVGALNVRAWGAWQARVSLSPWFTATVGQGGFDHYGVFVDDELVCTGVLAIDGQMAWIGFDATHPRHRSRQFRRSLTIRRLADARAAGCTIIHAEGSTDRLSGRSRVLDTLYVRRFFVHGGEPGPGS